MSGILAKLYGKDYQVFNINNVEMSRHLFIYGEPINLMVYPSKH